MIDLTKESLEAYRSKKEEIKELQYKLQNLNEGDIMIGYDTILDYRKGYPVPQAVVGVDWEKVDRTVSRYEKRIEVLARECEEVEIYIESITDSLTRRIFRMYYIEGYSQKNIGNIIHIDRSYISKKIKMFNETIIHKNEKN
ncbi:MAG: hypothetical protein NC434_11000 [Ruminococcus sp.]|nr:hypothetical protein [Ruminococcus sp.]